MGDGAGAGAGRCGDETLSNTKGYKLYLGTSTYNQWDDDHPSLHYVKLSSHLQVVHYIILWTTEHYLDSTFTKYVYNTVQGMLIKCIRCHQTI